MSAVADPAVPAPDPAAPAPDPAAPGGEAEEAGGTFAFEEAGGTFVFEAPNPVHFSARPTTRWTTVNFSEACPGLQTPLGWTYWDHSMAESVAWSFYEMGVFRKRGFPAAFADEPFAAAFYGRVAGNVDIFHYAGDRMPGSSGDIVVEKMLGAAADSGTARKPLSAYARYPVVAVKLPRAARRAARVLPGQRAEVADWWRRSVLDRPPENLEQAQTLLAGAANWFIDIGVHHALVSMLGNGMLDQLSELSERATGDPSLAMELATGYGGMEELDLIEDLWSVSTDELEIDEAIRRHGYHGPEEGNVASRSWREDRSPLEAMIASYRRAGVESPREREAAQAERRLEAEARLLEGLPATKRAAARFALRLARRYIPLREVGKAGFLHAVDGARCAARSAGAMLTERGVLDDPEDGFFLTYDELLELPAGPLQDLVAERREHHRRYEPLALPHAWTGNPVPVERAATGDADAPSGAVEGIGIVGGRVTGRARVVRDPGTADLEPGDILVCATTDPSWTPLFMVADALVIDTGGAMSHGAIVARELGVTCVINTVRGTREIPDGATITVDGTTGVVTVEAE